MEVKYLRADLAIVHGPETVEAEGFFVAREEALVGVPSRMMVYELTTRKSDPSHPNPGFQHSDQSWRDERQART